LWKFRYFLRDNKKVCFHILTPPRSSFSHALFTCFQALIKFLKSVEWNQIQEQEVALELLDQWEAMDLDDALELLSAPFSHVPRLRHYAVKRLETYSDDDLQYYLLQLVQALRYDKSPLADLASFLIRRGIANPVIGNYLYWYLKVECADPMGSDLFQRVLKEFLQALSRVRHHAQKMTWSSSPLKQCVCVCVCLCLSHMMLSVGKRSSCHGIPGPRRSH